MRVHRCGRLLVLPQPTVLLNNDVLIAHALLCELLGEGIGLFRILHRPHLNPINLTLCTKAGQHPDIVFQ